MARAVRAPPKRLSLLADRPHGRQQAPPSSTRCQAWGGGDLTWPAPAHMRGGEVAPWLAHLARPHVATWGGENPSWTGRPSPRRPPLGVRLAHLAGPHLATWGGEKPNLPTAPTAHNL